MPRLRLERATGAGDALLGRICAALIVQLSFLATLPAEAQSYPNRAIRLIVPFTAGGGVDIVDRILAQKVRELLALARSAKGRLTYASSGVGISTHLAMELFNVMTKTHMVHVPYKSTSQKNMDVISGQVELMFAAIPSVTSHLKDGRMHAIGVSGSGRSAVLPDVPTIAAAGVPGYDLLSWNGVLAPAGTSAEVIARLNAETIKALAHADVSRRLATEGAEPAPSSPSEFAGYIKAEIAKYASVIAAAGIAKE
jgi:tripartite-type tricarboxylate transporter receptor subunit TctC